MALVLRLERGQVIVLNNADGILGRLAITAASHARQVDLAFLDFADSVSIVRDENMPVQETDGGPLGAV